MIDKYKYKVVSLSNGSCFVPPTSEFYLRYKKGTKVKAKKGTLGIMVFATRKHAVEFMEITHCVHRHIKRVLPIGTPTIPEYVAGLIYGEKGIGLFNKTKLKDRAHDVHCIKPPIGTVCYPEVIVVD